MPLNPIIKPKLNEWFTEMKIAIQSGDVMSISSKTGSISTAGEIFTDDFEWAAELFVSGLELGFLVYLLRDWEDKSEEKKKAIIEIVSKQMDIAKESIEKENWLEYHKSIRNMMYEINKIT
jgi:hypothetical protein